MNDLALIDRARVALAEARTIEEVLDLRDKAAALAHYVACKSGAEESERYANEIRFRAERRIGELTRAMEKAAGRPAKKAADEIVAAEARISKAAALAAAGIRTEDASRYERIATIPAATFEREVVKPEATTRSLARLAPTKAAKREPVKIARPSVDERILAQRVALFRADLARVVKKHVARWPSGARTKPLVDALVEVSRSIQEEV